MKRELYNSLLKWKEDSERKPMLLQGARQVGKTYLINMFGKKEYKNFYQFNFEKIPQLKELFKESLNPATIISNLSLYSGVKIEPHNTLIFFDEIQECEEALSSLKYFHEEAQGYQIIAAGSLLGVSLGKRKSFPVGKVNFYTLYPLNFSEYLTEFGEELLLEKLKTEVKESLNEVFHNKLLAHLKKYLYLGGMPEVLNNFKNNNDIAKARKIQNEILQAYKKDFSKHTDKSKAVKVSEIWNSIPAQLSKENKKFKYSDVRKKARASMYGQTMEWLKRAGLINVVYNLKVPKLPLTGYTDYSKFKIYLLDTGLLGAMLNIASEIITKPTELYSEFNGAFIENYVANELTGSNYKELFYWTSKSDAEVDFIIQHKNKIYPLEVKSGMSRNLKSLRSYADKYNPTLIFRTSPRNFSADNDFINCSLYQVFNINSIILANEKHNN